MPEEISQENLVKEFYIKNPNREIQHQEAVDWLTSEYTRRTGKIFRDPDRAIRKLSQSGFLIKIRKGVYLLTGRQNSLKSLLDKEYSDSW